MFNCFRVSRLLTPGMDKYAKLKCQLPLFWVLDLHDKEKIPNAVKNQMTLYFENTFAQAFVEFFTENDRFRKRVFEDARDELKASLNKDEDEYVTNKYVDLDDFTKNNFYDHEETPAELEHETFTEIIMDKIRELLPKYFSKILHRMSTIQRSYEKKGPFPLLPPIPHAKTVTYMDLMNFLFPENKLPFIQDLERSDIFENTMFSVLCKDFREKEEWWITKDKSSGDINMDSN